MAKVILIEASPLHADGSAATVRLAGGGSRGYDHKGHTDWLSGVANRPRFSTAIGWDASGPTGGSVPQTGAIRFSTVDTARLTSLAGYYWKGAAITVSIGDDSSASPTWSVIMQGTVAEQPKTDGAGILFMIADLSGDLNKPVCPDTFDGSGGIEGGTDAAGRLKRRSWGKCWNVELRPLDTANNIYEAGDPAWSLDSFIEVRDKAVAAQSMTVIAWAGSIVATLTALQVAVVVTGGCAVAPSIACVKWWTVPSGPLTADLKTNSTALKAADIVSLLLTNFSTISFGNYTATAAFCSGETGLHCDDGSETVSSALNRLLLPLFLVPVLEASGTLYVRQITFDDPVETLTFDTCDRDTILPPMLVRSVGYQQNNRIQGDGEIAADLLALNAFNLVDRANMYIAGSTVAKVSGASAYGNASVYSREAYTTPLLNFTYAKPTAGAFIGFRDAATAYSGYASLSESFSLDLGAATAHAFYGGANHGTAAITAGSRFQIRDDGVTVHYVVDGVEIATSPSSGTAKVLDSDFYSVGAEANNISFSASGAAGASGIVPYLTNPAVSISTAADGTGGSFTAAGGNLVLNLGGVPLTSGVSYQVVSGSTTGGITISINPSTGAYTVSGLTADSGSATLRATYNGHDYDQVYNISKSKTGAAAPILTLQASAQAFNYDSTGTLTSASTINLPVILQGVTGTATYAATAYNSSNSPLGSVTLSGTGNNKSLTAANFLAAPTTAYVIVTATLGALSDQVTLYKLVAGSSAITPMLTNEAATVAADSAGTVASFPAAVNGTMRLFQGTTQLTSGVSYSVVSGSTTGGLVISINPTTGDYTVTGLTSDTGSVTLRATYNSLPYDKTYTLAKSKAGSNGAGQFTLINAVGFTANMTINGSSATKTSGGAGYNASVVSKEGYALAAIVTFSPHANGQEFAMGLSRTPNSSVSFDVEFCIVCRANQSIEIFEGGVSQGVVSGVTWAAGDTLSVAIKGDASSATANYQKGATVLKSPSTATAGATWYLDSSFTTVGAQADNITFAKAGADGSSGTSVTPAVTPNNGSTGTYAPGGVALAVGKSAQVHFTGTASYSGGGAAASIKVQLQYQVNGGGFVSGPSSTQSVNSATSPVFDFQLSSPIVNSGTAQIFVEGRAVVTVTSGTATWFWEDSLVTVG